MKKNTKILLGSSLIIGSILALLFIVTPASSGSEVTISDLKNNPEEYYDTYITTEGYLDVESIDWNADDIELRFDIEGEDGEKLSVFHHGVRPDNFKEDVIIIVQGFMKENGIFEAEKVQTRCPSKYEGMDSDEYDPEFHRNLDIKLHDKE